MNRSTLHHRKPAQPTIPNPTHPASPKMTIHARLLLGDGAPQAPAPTGDDGGGGGAEAAAGAKLGSATCGGTPNGAGLKGGADGPDAAGATIAAPQRGQATVWPAAAGGTANTSPH